VGCREVDEVPLCRRADLTRTKRGTGDMIEGGERGGGGGGDAGCVGVVVLTLKR